MKLDRVIYIRETQLVLRPPASFLHSATPDPRLFSLASDHSQFRSMAPQFWSSGLRCHEQVKTEVLLAHSSEHMRRTVIPGSWIKKLPYGFQASARCIGEMTRMPHMAWPPATIGKPGTRSAMHLRVNQTKQVQGIDNARTKRGSHSGWKG